MSNGKTALDVTAGPHSASLRAEPQPRLDLRRGLPQVAWPDSCGTPCERRAARRPALGKWPAAVPASSTVFTATGVTAPASAEPCGSGRRRASDLRRSSPGRGCLRPARPSRTHPSAAWSDRRRAGRPPAGARRAISSSPRRARAIGAGRSPSPSWREADVCDRVARRCDRRSCVSTARRRHADRRGGCDPSSTRRDRAVARREIATAARRPHRRRTRSRQRRRRDRCADATPPHPFASCTGTRRSAGRPSLRSSTRAVLDGDERRQAAQQAELLRQLDQHLLLARRLRLRWRTRASAVHFFEALDRPPGPHRGDDAAVVGRRARDRHASTASARRASCSDSVTCLRQPARARGRRRLSTSPSKTGGSSASVCTSAPSQSIDDVARPSATRGGRTCGGPCRRSARRP